MSSSNCCFLTCIQISQKADQVVWYSHLFQNFPQLIVIHTVKGFGIVHEAEIDVFLEFSCFFHDPADVGNLISGSSAFSKTSLNIWKFMVHILLKPGLENIKHYFTSVWDEFEHSLALPFFGIEIKPFPFKAMQIVYIQGSGTRVSWKKMFPWIGVRRWFGDDSSALHWLCTLFLLLLSLH